MVTQLQFADARDNLMESLGRLHWLEPNRFEPMLREAKTVRDFYDGALALGYAANAKELRDTWDDRVHSLCIEILVQMNTIDAFFRVKLYPGTPEQEQDWKRSLLRDPSAKYAMRDDGSLEISLLDSKMHESTLHVRRVWSHVSNFGGCLTDFRIKLNQAQTGELRAKLAELRALGG